MHFRAFFILLATTLSLVATLPARASAVEQPNISFCPPGIEQIQLGNTVENAQQHGVNVGNEQVVHQHRPAFFASPLQFDGPLHAASSGTWSKDKKTWQICLLAPPKSTSSSSLTLILENLRLPLGSKLDITSSGGSKEILTSFSDGGSLFTRQKATKLMAGDALLLTYTSGRKLGFSNKLEQPLQQAVLSKWQPTIEIKAVLQSNSAKFSAEMAKSTSTTAPTRSLLAALDANNYLESQPGAPQPEILSPSEQAAASDAESLANTKDFFSETVEFSTEQIGASVPCFANAACVASLDKARRSTVLLMLVSDFGGRFCTGSLINGPKPDEHLILTANHCRETDDDVTIASTWGVVLENEEPCPSAERSAAAVRRMLLSHDAAVVTTKQVIQGLEVAFSDEQSDVMVLRLKNPIPQGKTD
jgi:hypothetical protein